MTNKNNNTHESVKKKLKVIGAVVLAAGIICTVIGLVDFFAAFNSESAKPPKLFFLLFIGILLLGVGLSLMAFGFRREIMRYAKNEGVPVVNEASEELSLAVKNVVSAAKEGVLGENKGKVVCECGAVNPGDNKFCKECGKALYSVCPGCGAKVERESKFCGECGAKL